MTTSIGIIASKPNGGNNPPGVPPDIINIFDTGATITVTTDTTSPGFVSDSGTYFPGPGWVHSLRGAGGLQLQAINFFVSGLTTNIRDIYVYATNNGAASSTGLGIQVIDLRYGSPVQIVKFPVPAGLPRGASALLNTTTTQARSSFTVQVLTNANNLIFPNDIMITNIPFIGVSVL